MRIMIIMNIPNPYRIPLFNKINKLLSEKSSRLLIVFGSQGYSRRKWQIDLAECGFDYEILNSIKIPLGNSERTLLTYSGLYRALAHFQPQCVIVIGFSLATIKLWFYSFFAKTSYIIWSGSITTKGRKDSFFRKLQRRVLMQRAKGFLAYGSQARKYLVALGAKEDKIHIAINTTDVSFYKHQAEQIRESLNGEKKKDNLLYIGYLTKGKRIDLLLRIVQILATQRTGFQLDIVGDGPEHSLLKNLSLSLGIESLVKFHGFKQKNELPYFLGRADCFLFPSEYDIWGLVLVEAMSAGIPCISSIYAGATHDLIIDGKTGFAMNFSDAEQVSQKIEWILDNPSEANKIGQNASQFIAENVNLQKSAEGFLDCIFDNKTAKKTI